MDAPSVMMIGGFLPRNQPAGANRPLLFPPHFFDGLATAWRKMTALKNWSKPHGDDRLLKLRCPEASKEHVHD
jgi:hypothetical protein